ncbi:TetR/AcrR family transcriptional regulator [Marmoricola sp. OAE513]|uniref:TetR/AcrR family transcriptional regulator n=1 Tax=Marmoricola sp. OAE513 TaxID=2817894 RepID=UPI001AEA326E
MTATPETRPRRRSEPRNRLLATATQVFYAKGIHAVGIEEIVAAAEITRSTLYRHFPSKDDLVVGYLQAASEYERQAVAEALAPDLTPADAVRAVARSVVAQLSNPAYRGCAFLNAAAEFPDAEHPVHGAVLEHRAWFAALVLDLFEAVGRATPDGGTSPDRLAALFVMLRDGAMTSGCLGDPRTVGATFQAGVEELLATAG